MSNADAIGTRLTAITADGNRQIREIRNGSGYGAGTEIAAYFGLGSNSSVDT
ncbi:MAG: ASPIC/UnbV domain-containing protein, partial [bacterium]